MKANDRYHSLRHTRNPGGTASGKQQTQIPLASLADSTAKQWLRRLSAATDIPDQESWSVCAKFAGNLVRSDSSAVTVRSPDSATSIPVTPLPELSRKPVRNNPVPANAWSNSSCVQLVSREPMYATESSGSVQSICFKWSTTGRPASNIHRLTSRRDHDRQHRLPESMLRVVIRVPTDRTRKPLVIR